MSICSSHLSFHSPSTPRSDAEGENHALKACLEARIALGLLAQEVLDALLRLLVEDGEDLLVVEAERRQDERTAGGLTLILLAQDLDVVEQDLLHRRRLQDLFADAQDAVQDALGMAFLAEHAHELDQDVLECEALKPLAHGRGQFPCEALAVEIVDDLEDDGIDDLHNTLAAAAVLEIVDEQSRCVLIADDAHDVLRAQEVIARECHDGIHDALPVAPQDIRAVRDAERLAEERRDGKPVRQPADRRGQEAVMEEPRRKAGAAGRQCADKAGSADAQCQIRLIFLLQPSHLRFSRRDP
jgi:hypothetical protein